MQLLAISGSTRLASTNTALLRFLSENAPQGFGIKVIDNLIRLPIFSADLELEQTPKEIIDFAQKIAAADGIIISSPEYIHAIPGGLKNAIDWLVSRYEIIDKPIALLHASHGGDDLLYSLRLVLNTISQNFEESIFEQFNLRSLTPQQIFSTLNQPQNKLKLVNFIKQFETHIRNSQSELK